MFKRLPIPKFFTSQWLKVARFTSAIDMMDEQGIRIEAKSVIPIMESILDEVSDQDTIDGVSVKTLHRGLDKLIQANQLEEMNDEWFLEKFREIYQHVLDLRTDEDYVVNPRQMDRFLDLVSFFIHHISADGAVEIEKTEPKQCFGGVTATFLVMTLRGDEVLEFCRVLKICSAVSIDSCEDGACISCTVPDVFAHKDSMKA